MLNQTIYATLERIKEEINQKFGFHQDLPRINYGPCAVFAQVFFKEWNALFHKKVHICFIFSKSKRECNHVLIRLPSGELYDGGMGVHEDAFYQSQFIIEEMLEYDEFLLDKWAYGLKRKYEACPAFKREIVENIVHSNLRSCAHYFRF